MAKVSHDTAAYSTGTTEHTQAIAAFSSVTTRITEEVEDRRRAPRDDGLAAISTRRSRVSGFPDPSPSR
jgi:hypothetical protein